MPARRKAGPRTKAHRALLNAHRHRYEELLAHQGGGCAICGREPSPTRRLDMDHDHKTMEVRGLLCVRHNRAIPDWLTAEDLDRMAAYLRNPPFKELPVE